MEKKFKFADKPARAKIIYAIVIAILCVSIIVVGIVSASSKNKDDITPPSNDDSQNNTPPADENPTPPPEDTPKKQTFVSPIKGVVVKEHNLELPVFSHTLGEWRVHAGIDISAEEGSPVYASEDGVISAIYKDVMHGYTVEITHDNDIKTKYCNLAKDDEGLLTVGSEVKSGDRIGTVGDTSLSELGEESHLHFEVMAKGVKVNPLDYISEESKHTSLGISEE